MVQTGRSGYSRKIQHDFRPSRYGRAVLPLSLLLLGSACGKKPAPPPAGPAEVTVVTVVPKDVPIYAEYVAQTQSSRLVNIQARVSGFLDKRVYTEGAVVKEGEPLFLMDRKPFQVQVDGAAAALERQKASMETARLNLERTRPLAAQNALSQKDLDDATGQFQSASAAVEQAKADLAAQQLNLSYCTISSPATGVTSAALQQDGTYISSQNNLLTTVAVLDPIWVNFSLSEGEMQRVRNLTIKGLIVPPKDMNYEVVVLMPDGTRFPHVGRITFADPSFNSATGTFLLRASVANPNGVLRPNQHVRARITGAIRPKAILVPQRAVQQGAKGAFVWVVSPEGTAEARPVRESSWHGEDWFVDEGLKPGDRVVVDGGMTLRPGAPVKVTPAGAEPAPAAPASPGPPGAAPKTAKSAG